MARQEKDDSPWSSTGEKYGSFMPSYASIGSTRILVNR
tara:strand:- start:212 stop:325 length:114 start_codon:yes stop_codon:yes gene_type:complete